jgi:hypothetical protein
MVVPTATTSLRWRVIMYCAVCTIGATNSLEAGGLWSQRGSKSFRAMGVGAKECHGLKKDRLTCRFRRAPFDVLVGVGLSGPGV